MNRPLPAKPIQLGNLTLGDEQPLICAPSAELSAVYRWAQLPPDQRPDLCEWRMDLSVLNPLFPSLLRQMFAHLPPLPLPLIITRRRRQEGGMAKDSQHRVNLLLASAEIAAAIDVELQSPYRDWLIARLPPQLPLIISWHDFVTTPPLVELQRVISAAAAVRDGQQTAVKFATMAHDAADAARVLQAVDWARREGFGGPIIGIAMGAAGAHTRAEAVLYGSDLSFARADLTGSAPGQMSVAHTRAAIAQLLAEGDLALSRATLAP